VKTADPAIVIAVARSWLGTPYHDQATHTRWQLVANDGTGVNRSGFAGG